MISNLFCELAASLPRIAEEGTDAESVPEIVLIERLAQTAEDLTAAANNVAVARSLLQALAVLDEQELASGCWRMASFPALLFSRSLLMGLGSKQYHLLAPGFWGSSDYLVDRQRDLLVRAEDLRRSAGGVVPPIRRVWVAWTLLAVDGRFLLVRREDPYPARPRSRGGFVLPGGRVSSSDLEALPLGARLDIFDSEKELPAAEVSSRMLGTAVRRELLEELELTTGCIASIEPIYGLIRYVAAEGARSNYATTEYMIQLFKTELTDIGKSGLLECLALNHTRFDWFTAAELDSGTNLAGSRAFVDALSSIVTNLDSKQFDAGIGHSPHEPITVPGIVGEPFLAGETGKERKVHVDLSPDEIDTLNWLAAVRRSDSGTATADNVMLASTTGWVLINDQGLFRLVQEMATKLTTTSLRILGFHGMAVRLIPSSVFFSASRLTLQIEDEDMGRAYRVSLKRDVIQSALGEAMAVNKTKSLPRILGTAISELAHGKYLYATNNIDTIKRVQREHREFLESVGARLIIRIVDGKPQLSAKPDPSLLG